MRRVIWGLAMCIAVIVLTTASVVSALSLDEAKAKGLVGERPTGYLGVVNGSNAEAQALIADINHPRLFHRPSSGARLASYNYPVYCF